MEQNRKPIPQTEGLTHNNVNAIVIDTTGCKWFGTDNGVSRYIGNNRNTFRTNDGLSADLFDAIAIDNAGSTRFGCYGGNSKGGCFLGCLNGD